MAELSLVLSDDNSQYQTILGQFITTSAIAVAADVVLAQAAATNAANSATASANSSATAAASALQTAADRVATGADVVTTNAAAASASSNAMAAGSSASAASASQGAAHTSEVNAAASASSASTSAANAASTLANALVKANNLSDVANAATARSNLGLGNVTNTSDVNKPVSTAQQTALDLKANVNSPSFTGTVTVPTGFNVTNATGQANFNINGAASNSRQFQFQTSGSNRWTLATDQTTEASGNLGSDFGLYRFDNTGTYIDNPLKIFRNSGQMFLSVRPVFNGNTPYDSGNFNPNSISGRTNGVAVASGLIGEIIEQTAAAQSTTSGPVVNLITLSLPPGVWDVSGSVHFIPNATTTMSGRASSISLVSGANGVIGDLTLYRSTLGAGLDEFIPTPAKRINMSVTTPVYLTSNVVFGGGTMQVEGKISARRVA